MKNVKITRITNLIFLLIILLMMASCSEDDVIKEIEDQDPVGQNDPDPDPEPDTDPMGNEDPDANKISESLVFKNATSFTGTIPSNASGYSLKINRDTVGLIVEGDIPPFIGISKADGSMLQTSTAYIQVEGSDTYFEAEFEGMENDTLVYLNFEFEDAGWDYPLSFDINVAPINDSGTSIDVITIPIIVEENATNNGGSCTIEEFLNGKNEQTYVWFATWDYYEKGSSHLEDGTYYFEGLYGSLTVSGDPKVFPQDVNGCCTSSGSLYSDCNGFPTHRTVEGETRRTIGEVYLAFWRDGDVSGSLLNYEVQNVDPSNFDFCNGVPAYTISSQDNYFVGTYTFNPTDCSITIDFLEGWTDPVLDDFGNPILDSNGNPLEWPRLIYADMGSKVKYTRHGRGIKSVTTDVETNITSLAKFYAEYK